MKFTDQIIVEYPLGKVFQWFSQPEHIAQLITVDLKSSYLNNKPDPAHLTEKIASWRQRMEQSESIFKIQNLSMTPLQVEQRFNISLDGEVILKNFPHGTPCIQAQS